MIRGPEAVEIGQEIIQLPGSGHLPPDIILMEIGRELIGTASFSSPAVTQTLKKNSRVFPKMS